MDRLKRLRRELLSIEQESDEVKKQMRIEVGNDLSKLTAFLSGPPDSPFAGGTFTLQIHIPAAYPFEPPRVTFLTKIWHPNISLSSGYVCFGHAERQMDTGTDPENTAVDFAGPAARTMCQGPA